MEEVEGILEGAFWEFVHIDSDSEHREDADADDPMERDGEGREFVVGVCFHGGDFVGFFLSFQAFVRGCELA